MFDVHRILNFILLYLIQANLFVTLYSNHSIFKQSLTLKCFFLLEEQKIHLNLILCNITA
jgi:hypothetical protein